MTAAHMPIYDLSLNLRVGWEAHSLSNAGSNGTNRLLGRRILLADGVEADAASGNILKRYHAILTAEYLQSLGEPLCPACAIRDGRRAAGLSATDHPLGHPIVRCALCDTHGYLVVKRAGDAGREAAESARTERAETRDDADVATRTRNRNRRNTTDPVGQAETIDVQPRSSKASLVEFSFAIGLPPHQAETRQLFTRIGDGRDGGQMLMTMPNRSGVYAMHVRYRAVGIGADTATWQMMVPEPSHRLARHRAILSALRDQVLSPGGAHTATMLPHVTSLVGAICMRHTVGRAPVYSGLDLRFVERLQALKMADLTVFAFENIEAFAEVMDTLITNSVPAEIPVRSTS